MSYVVFRVEKLKSFGSIAGSGAHNLRTRPTANADPARRQDNVVLVGPRTESEVVAAVHEKLANIKVRKNAVLAVEAIISASPEYFRPGDPARGGYWEKDRLDAWRKAVEPWIKERFPDAVSVVLHLDEITPHYQIIDVPIDRERNKLDCRGKYGGERSNLAKWQTDAARPVKHLGIERGKPGSKARHTSVQEWYRLMNSDNPPPLPAPLPAPKKLPPAKMAELVPGTAAHKKRKAAEEKYQRQRQASGCFQRAPR